MTDSNTAPLMDSSIKRMTEAAKHYAEEWAPEWGLRGLTEDTILGYRLGSVHDPIPEHARYDGWLSIPYPGYNLMTGEWECRGMRFRCPEDHDHKAVHGSGKYGSVSGQRTHIFNVPVLSQGYSVVSIVEGEVDSIVLNQCGIPAVGIPGANNWKHFYARLFDGCDRVVLWGDPDKAGREFNSDVMKNLPQAVPAGLSIGDVNETYLQGGEEAIKDIYEKALK